MYCFLLQCCNLSVIVVVDAFFIFSLVWQHAFLHCISVNLHFICIYVCRELCITACNTKCLSLLYICVRYVCKSVCMCCMRVFGWQDSKSSGSRQVHKHLACLDIMSFLYALYRMCR